jgi:RNA polymerase sigma-70 factor, ECF subfamily
VYPELLCTARQYMRRESAGNTLQPTALVHEAYLRLVDAQVGQWQDRAHFFAVCAQMIRRILVSAQADCREARRRRSDDDRGDPRKGRVVELRFFGGLSVQETAQVVANFRADDPAGLAAGAVVAGARDGSARGRGVVRVAQS